MSSFTDLLPSHGQQGQTGQTGLGVGWIHELARAEIHPDAERLLQLGKSFDPQQLVEESTIGFLSQLREQFNEYARVFNALSENSARFQEVKVYNIAQTAADFMMFRNQIKLLVSNTAHGVIHISFAQHVRGNLAINGQVQTMGNSDSGLPASLAQAQELLAQVGPFRDVYWTFQGEKVSADQVAKFYFSEFTRVTRDNRRSRAGNQVLIDQIKALLQEKGLEL
ncbi:MAG TPA: hypothetical protein DIS93_02785 [Bdellovibrionales bacterium]|nr:hypothetical protein [Bdellovibrionales bacterium]